MSADDEAQKILADLDAKAKAANEALRAKTAEARSRLEQGMLNLQPQAGDQPSSGSSDVAELSWDLEASENGETGLAAGFDEFDASAEPPLFNDELDVSTDDDGIPLGN